MNVVCGNLFQRKQRRSCCGAARGWFGRSSTMIRASLVGATAFHQAGAWSVLNFIELKCGSVICSSETENMRFAL
jgi:hypothetical protein